MTGEIHYGPAARILQGPDEDIKKFMAFYGKTIKRITCGGSDVVVYLENGTIAFVSDEPDCCANHYMRTDEKLEEYFGAKLLGAVVKTKVKHEDRGDDVLETMFFEIKTSKGAIDFSSHNSHNGYYSGVGVNFKVLASATQKGAFRNDEQGDAEVGADGAERMPSAQGARPASRVRRQLQDRRRDPKAFEPE